MGAVGAGSVRDAGLFLFLFLFPVFVPAATDPPQVLFSPPKCCFTNLAAANHPVYIQIVHLRALHLDPSASGNTNCSCLRAGGRDPPTTSSFVTPKSDALQTPPPRPTPFTHILFMRGPPPQPKCEWQYTLFMSGGQSRPRPTHRKFFCCIPK